MNQENNPAAPASDLALGEHLEELRSRLWIIVIAVGAVLAICLFFYRDLWEIVMLPRERAAQLIGKPAVEIFPLQFMRPLEGLSSAFGVAVKTALLFTLPIILTQLWLFAAPGLTDRERRAVSWATTLGSGLFLGGASVAFFYAVPLGLSYLSLFDQSLSSTITQWRVDAYLDFLFMTCAGFGLGFELPLVMAAAAWTGAISPEQIGRYWRQAVFALAVLSALLTPPDPYTMLLLTGSLSLLYGIGYFLARLVYPKENDISVEND